MKGCPSLFSYLGGKSHIVPVYPGPQHGLIIEPFAGGAAYARRYWDREVIINDRNPLIYNIWNWLLSVEPSDILNLPVLCAGEDLRDYFLNKDERAFLSFWICQGSAGLRNICSSMGERKWTERTKQRIVDSLPKIKHWKVTNKEYYELEDLEATWFVDPPYSGARFSANYTFDWKGIDYLDLSQWCRSRKGQVIVCEAKGANWLPFKLLLSPSRSLRSTHGEFSREEVYWLNNGRFEERPPIDIEELFE